MPLEVASMVVRLTGMDGIRATRRDRDFACRRGPNYETVVIGQVGAPAWSVEVGTHYQKAAAPCLGWFATSYAGTAATNLFWVAAQGKKSASHKFEIIRRTGSSWEILIDGTRAGAFSRTLTGGPVVAAFVAQVTDFDSDLSAEKWTNLEIALDGKWKKASQVADGVGPVGAGGLGRFPPTANSNTKMTYDKQKNALTIRRAGVPLTDRPGGGKNPPAGKLLVARRNRFLGQASPLRTPFPPSSPAQS